MEAVARTVTIDAPPAAVWAVLVDVEGWPAWASYLAHLRREEGTALGLGSRVRVTPKGLPSAVWTVTRYEPGRSYLWESGPLPGLRLVGDHVVEVGHAGTTATLSLSATGPLAGPLAPLLRALFRRNTGLATGGLKRHCEARR